MRKKKGRKKIKGKRRMRKVRAKRGASIGNSWKRPALERKRGRRGVKATRGKRDPERKREEEIERAVKKRLGDEERYRGHYFTHTDLILRR